MNFQMKKKAICGKLSAIVFLLGKFSYTQTRMHFHMICAKINIDISENGKTKYMYI